MMNKLVLDNGLTFRVDKHCGITRNNMLKLQKTRIRQAMYGFRQMFSQKTLEGCVCASEFKRGSMSERIALGR